MESILREDLWAWDWFEDRDCGGPKYGKHQAEMSSVESTELISAWYSPLYVRISRPGAGLRIGGYGGPKYVMANTMQK